MKAFFALILMTVSLPAVAAETDIYCKTDSDQIFGIESVGGDLCVRTLLTPDTQAACFIGRREAAIQILNSLRGKAVFDGSDSEYIENAQAKGQTAISYTIVDEANKTTSTGTLDRCTVKFFNRR